jgi:uncharacterized membrane protein HdeD (DUF308 family)
MRRGLGSLFGIISGIILIFMGIVNLFFFYGAKIDFLNWFKPGSPAYVSVIFFAAIFLVWEYKKRGVREMGDHRGKFIGVLILMMLFLDYYLKSVSYEYLFRDLFSLIEIGSLGHGIIMIVLGIFAIFDPSQRIAY